MTGQTLDVVDVGGPSGPHRGFSFIAMLALVVVAFAAGVGSRALIRPAVKETRPTVRQPIERTPPPGPRKVPSNVNAHLDEIQAAGRKILGSDALTIDVGPAVVPYDFHPGVDGDVVTLPGKAAQNDHDAQVLAWFGVMEVLFERGIVGGLPYDEKTVRCFDAFRALSTPRATTILSVGRAASVFWIEKYVGRTIGASDVIVTGNPAARFNDYVASMLTVLRMYPAQVAQRLARLSPSDRRSLLAFEQSVSDVFDSDTWRELQRAVPALIAQSLPSN